MHYNNTIEEQVQHVVRVKRHRVGFDIKPIIMPPTATIMQMDLLRVRAWVCAGYACAGFVCGLGRLSGGLELACRDGPAADQEWVVGCG